MCEVTAAKARKQQTPHRSQRADLAAALALIAERSCDLILTLPIRTKSEANGREHWHAKAKRVQQQRWVSFASVRTAISGLKFRTPLVVLLTRVGQRQLDDDNLAGALKAVRDGIADAFDSKDDGPGFATWVYEQTYGPPSVHVEIWSRPPSEAPFDADDFNGRPPGKQIEPR